LNHGGQKSRNLRMPELSSRCVKTTQRVKQTLIFSVTFCETYSTFGLLGKEGRMVQK